MPLYNLNPTYDIKVDIFFYMTWKFNMNPTQNYLIHVFQHDLNLTCAIHEHELTPDIIPRTI